MKKSQSSSSPELRSAQRIIALLILIIGCFVAWSLWFDVEQIARSTGQVIASSRTQLVQATNDGVIEKFLVREGSRVKKGDVLVMLEREQGLASLSDSRAKVAALKAALVRLHAEVLGRPLVFPPEVQQFPAFVSNQTELFQRRQRAVNQEAAALQSMLASTRDELSISEPLLKSGDISRVEISDFSTVLQTATRTVLDDDSYTAAAGVNDTFTTGTANGGYLGGTRLSTGDGIDAVTIGTRSDVNSIVDLGDGNDTLNTGSTQANFFVNGAQYIGGAGVDTLALATTTAFNFSTTASAGNFVKGFEIVSMAATGNQTLNLSLQDVLEFASGNAVADTLRITGSAGDVLNLQALGKTLSTPAPGTGNLTDVDGATYNVVASSAGNASANDVVIGAATYDVYQYQHGGHTINLLVNTLLTTTVV